MPQMSVLAGPPACLDRLIFLPSVTRVSAMSELTQLSNQMADAVERAARSLVTVFGRDRQPATGIVIGPDLVLTADHVLERDDNLQIAAHDGRKLAAHLAGRDPGTDLAVLRVTGLNAPVMATATSARVGSLALAVGRPGDEGVMASSGIVSAVGGPVKMGRAQLEKYLRTDATPYPGFSGGALVDAAGAAFGLLTTGLARGTALVIPMETSLRIAQVLASQGHIKRGYLGVVSQQVRLPPAQRSATQERGLLLVKVEEGSPAEQGGLLVGDIIMAVNGVPTHDADDLLGALGGGSVGKAAQIGIIRGGNAVQVTVVVGARD
jgi:S1-C subfamily serine protease